MAIAAKADFRIRPPNHVSGPRNMAHPGGRVQALFSGDSLRIISIKPIEEGPQHSQGHVAGRVREKVKYEDGGRKHPGETQQVRKVKGRVGLAGALNGNFAQGDGSVLEGRHHDGGSR